MDTVLFIVEALVVVGAIVMGTKSSGVALGIWGGVGVAVLVFVFGVDPGSPPIDAILIILSVILAAATMQVAGGIDWMVAMAARAISGRRGVRAPWWAWGMNVSPGVKRRPARASSMQSL